MAIVDGNLHTLPRRGRFAWENTLVQPNRGNRTVIMGMEDGPAALDPAVENSQIYMYVGKKEHRAEPEYWRGTGWTTASSTFSLPPMRRSRAKPLSRSARSTSNGC